MTTLIKAGLLGLAVTLACATGALAGKTTIPNNTTPPVVGVITLAALNAALEVEGNLTDRASSLTFDGTDYTVTIGGVRYQVSSASLASFIDLYR